VIDFQTTYAQSLIDDFSNPATTPHIAISVDMLDTGIDIPEIVNLVFCKPVRSKTKFWQMVGRGTRLCPNLFGPGGDKEYFYIFDWCRNFEFFNENPQTADRTAAESLAKRLFASRVVLVSEIDSRTSSAPPAEAYPPPPDSPVVHAGESGSSVDRATGLGDVREHLATDLRNEIGGMSLDNFIVRPRRRYVEKYSSAEAWEKVDADARHELIEHVAGLPSSVLDEDLAAKQFDLLVFRAELALLRADAAFGGLRAKISEIASLLEELENVPMVRAEIALIQEVQTDEFWQDITLPMLETVRRRLRALVKLIEYRRRMLVYSDFEDSTGVATDITVPGITVGTDMDAFRRKARVFLRPHENHIAVLKLKRNEPLTPTDLNELERIFLEAGIDATALGALQADGGLPRFVRSLVGLDRATAKRAFTEFLDGRRLSANQLDFLDLVIEHLTYRGVMDPNLLYEAPFTDFDRNGVEGVFHKADAVRLVQILREMEPRIAA
jgi:type I restriction enzyme, R subunit